MRIHPRFPVRREELFMAFSASPSVNYMESPSFVNSHASATWALGNGYNMTTIRHRVRSSWQDCSPMRGLMSTVARPCGIICEKCLRIRYLGYFVGILIE